MIKQVTILSLSLMLVACSKGGSSSSDKKEDTSGFNEQDFTLTQSADLKSYGQTTVSLELKNLGSDDVIYISTASSAIDNQKLSVVPAKTMLYPTGGSAKIAYQVSDLGVTTAPELKFNVTTASNRTVGQALTVKLEK